MSHTAVTPSEGWSPSSHHRRLERHFEALLARAQGGDPVGLRREWIAFETELLAHLALEESQILPELERLHPDEAATIRREHHDIRQSLLELGVNLELHLLRAEGVEALGTSLRDHARREESMLYPWAVSQLAPAQRKRLFDID